MEIKNKYKSPLSMKNLIIKEASFHLDDNGIGDTKIGLNVDHEIKEVDDSIYSVELSVSLDNESNTFSAYVKCSALFNTSNENYSLIKKNAISIMFPYIRSYISLLTTQPGMEPIVLPPINIVALLSENEK